MSDAPIEVTGAAGIVRTLVPDDATIEVRLGDAVRVPFEVVEPVHDSVTQVRWRVVYAPRVLMVDFSESVGVGTFEEEGDIWLRVSEPDNDLRGHLGFAGIAVGTGAIVVQSAEFRLEDDENWYPATVTQGAVRIVRVLPPVVDTVAGDLEKVE